MNEAVVWIVLPALAVLGIVGYFALWLWVNYRTRPEPRAEVEHEGAGEDYADDLHAWNTDEQVPVLMTHDQYLAAGRHHELPGGPIFPALEAPPAPEPTADLDLVDFATGGAFQPVPYAVDGEAWDTPDPLTVPVDEQVDAHIFDGLCAVTPVNLDWKPSWASSYTQYLKVLQPTYALPAGSRDFTGSFAVVPA